MALEMNPPAESGTDNTTNSDISLPRNADPTGVIEQHKIAHETDSTDILTVSALSEKTEEVNEPVSPGRNRKRHSDEVYQKPDRPVTTTPQKTPPRKSSLFQQHLESTKNRLSNPFATREPSNLQEVTNVGSSPRDTMSANSQQPRSDEEMTTRKTTTFIDDVESYQRQLDDEFDHFSRQLEERDRSADLEQFNWDEMEKKYRDDISPLLEEEDVIRRELGQRLQQFMLWMQVSGEKESERAIKRLRTRSTYVRNSEAQLEEKQQHYGKVLEAFQTAMHLLNT